MVGRIKLTQALEGSRVRIRKVDSTSAARGRLCALGLTPGAEIDVFSQNGQCRIRIHNACLALCNSLADCIECEAMDLTGADLAADFAGECNVVDCGIALCPAATGPADQPASRELLET